MNFTYRSNKKAISRLEKNHFGRNLFLVILLAIIAVGAWLTLRPTAVDIDSQLSAAFGSNAIAPLDFGDKQDPNLVALGESLFFDKEVSGNRDISCATCHHPDKAGVDRRALPIGVGGSGLGEDRVMGTATELVPRNAPELFNRGSSEWSTMFWDGRVAFHEAYDIDSPADEFLPVGLSGVLAAQALFPPTSRAEMRGHLGDNELGDVANDDLVSIWDGIMSRLMAIPAYRELFATAYPDVPDGEWTIAHFGNAIAAYEIAAFTFENAPWDRYVNGDLEALSAEQKRGALLYFGEAGCGQCHNGPLLTDQQYHNIGVPHNGPGKSSLGIDPGRAMVTNEEIDAFAFRTPPLRNVALTPPYMHNGYYTSLEAAVNHHFNAAEVIDTYPDSYADRQMAAVSSNTVLLRAMVRETLTPKLDGMRPLNDSEMADLMSFLDALTAPEAVDLSALTPSSVPSGLVVTD